MTKIITIESLIYISIYYIHLIVEKPWYKHTLNLIIASNISTHIVLAYDRFQINVSTFYMRALIEGNTNGNTIVSTNFEIF